MLVDYGRLLILLLFGLSVGVGTLLVVGPLFRFKSQDDRAHVPFECGMEPVGSPYVPIDLRFYLFALLFVLFDVEALFLFPWAVVFKELGWLGFVEMMAFVAVLMFGLFYAWRKGGLEWPDAAAQAGRK